VPAAAADLDRTDPLASLRDRFILPEGVTYLDGNSLGALPVGVAERVNEAITRDWGVGLIRSWNDAGWYPAPARVGAMLAPIVGADPAHKSVVVCDSTSVDLFKALHAACSVRPSGRRVLIAESDNFPTNAYIAASVAAAYGLELRAVASDQVVAAVERAGSDVAAVSLTHVNYRTGRQHDMIAVTDQVHAAGALVLWDLCHSAGVYPVALDQLDVDFAVGCTYKFLNGGPGSPAFLYVNRRWIDAVSHPLQGWFGHRAPFEFDSSFEAAPGIQRMLTGTSPQLGLIALEAALAAYDGVDINAVRAKGEALTDRFISLVDETLGDGSAGAADHDNLVSVVSPRQASERGSQVSLSHPNAYAVMQALIERGVIGDFRAPDILRFGFQPLYVRFSDVDHAVGVLAEVITTRAWDQPRFHARKSVT
jgi:kynureninase